MLIHHLAESSDLFGRRVAQARHSPSVNKAPIKLR